MGRMQQVAMQTGDIARDTMARVFGKRQMQTSAVNRRMLAEHIIRNELTEMALARFKWTGLPDSASEFWIERMLLTRGACLVGRDPRNNAVLALQANTVGPRKIIYDSPYDLTARHAAVLRCVGGCGMGCALGVEHANNPHLY